MDPKELQRTLRESAGLRVGPHMADYVATQLKLPDAANGFFAMGADARTGRPIRQKITPAMLDQESHDP